MGMTEGWVLMTYELVLLILVLCFIFIGIVRSLVLWMKKKRIDKWDKWSE